MDDIGRKHDPPQCNVASGDRADGTSGDRRYFPPWMREQLIAQFQGIDHSTRSEAVMQIEAYERNFMAIFGEGSGGGPARKRQDLSAVVPPHSHRKANGQSGA
jgi:hypothetical protein